MQFSQLFVASHHRKTNPQIELLNTTQKQNQDPVRTHMNIHNAMKSLKDETGSETADSTGSPIPIEEPVEKSRSKSPKKKKNNYDLLVKEKKSKQFDQALEMQ